MAESPQISMVALASLVPSPTNPRKAFDQTSIRELAASLKAQGMLQPILVRPIPFGKVPREYELDLFDEFYEVVVGGRRYRAAQIAGLEEVPCLVREMSDLAVREAQVEENAKRKDVTALEEADAYGEILEFPEYRDSGDAVGALSERLSVSKSQVYARLKLRSLGPEGRELVANGSMSPSVALDVARLQPRDQAKACKALFGAGGEVTLKNARDWIRGNLLLRVSEFPFDVDDAGLLPTAGACSSCPKNTAVDRGAFEGEGGGKKGLCMDPACFKAKMKAREEQVYRELLAEHGEACLVATKYGKPKRLDVLSDSMYTQVGENAPGAKPAIDVEPYSLERTFRVLWIRLLNKGNAVEKADHEAEQKKGAKVAKLFRGELMEAVVRAHPKSVDRALLVGFLRAVWKRSARDYQRVVAQGLGLEPHTEEGGNAGYKDYSRICDSWTEDMPEAALAEILLRLMAAPELVVSLYDSRSHYEVPPILGGLAQPLDVDTLDLLSAAQERYAPTKLASIFAQEDLAVPTVQHKAGDASHRLAAHHPVPDEVLLRWASGEAMRVENGERVSLDFPTLEDLYYAARSSMADRADDLDASWADGYLLLWGRRFEYAPGGVSYSEAVPA